LTESLPLAGRTILVTRPRHQSRPLTEALDRLGATVVEAPAISIGPPSDFSGLDEALRHLATYDWVVFTSANGVEAFFDRLAAVQPEGRVSTRRLAAIGPATAESLRERGLEPDVVPEKHVAEEVFRAIAAGGEVAGKRFLLPRADIAREALPALLRAAGAIVDAVSVYRTFANDEEMRQAASLVAGGDVAMVIFASASAVRSFFAKVDARFFHGRVAAASIGPITSDALRALGIEPEVEAEPSTTKALVEAIVRHYVQ
jgi:uroporphyrinogen III methyltransferase/synthase